MEGQLGDECPTVLILGLLIVISTLDRDMQNPGDREGGSSCETSQEKESYEAVI